MRRPPSGTKRPPRKAWPVRRLLYGLLYLNGDGVSADPVQAANWFRVAAEQGSAVAQNNLGLMHLKGQGVSQDDAKAAKWMRSSAEQGFAVAQNRLGAMYEHGRGVEKSPVTACMWYSLAAAQGHENSRRQRDIIAQLMTAEQIAQSEQLAAAWTQSHEATSRQLTSVSVPTDE